MRIADVGTGSGAVAIALAVNRPNVEVWATDTSAAAVELARENGTPVRKKPEEIYDNSFVNNLEKSGFLKEIWGGENYRR